MGKSRIEWTGETWNPMTGCSMESDGCWNCYAKRNLNRWGKSFEVRLYLDRLSDPLRWRKHRKVFVCSMGDLFHFRVPEDYIWKIIDVVGQASKHLFMLLTKRPERMKRFFLEYYGERAPLPNLWLGVSAEYQSLADERARLLLQTPAAMRFVSCEPLLGAINLRRYLCGCKNYMMSGLEVEGKLPRGIDWVIAGGESGPGARECRERWLSWLRDQCQEYEVPFFLKQLGGWPDKRGGDKALLGGQLYHGFPKE